jgi:hypothetical protein
LQLAPPLGQHAGKAAPAELDGKCNAHRPAADNDDLISLFHYYSGSVITSEAKQSGAVHEN